MRATEYAKCRKNGMTYQQIADKFGVTHQAVHDSIRKHEMRGRNIKATTVCFPGLRQWMSENRMKVIDLERATGMPMYHALRSGNISNAKVDAILRLTGLTYEEAFGNTKAVS